MSRPRSAERLVDAGPDDRIYRLLLLLGPFGVALVATIGRSAVTVGIAVAYIGVFVGYVLYKRLR
ncbi:hypothetical protein [Halosolutus gelatinilyticus]|uniref:hypothetical protein n=1 Tax=Halosolutus gelatinilyticus TaxID=2931975 RepID=UPI001FF255D0|nr:hypothetical protein [Halosolutus gelatinilyticus]